MTKQSTQGSLFILPLKSLAESRDNQFIAIFIQLEVCSIKLWILKKLIVMYTFGLQLRD